MRKRITRTLRVCKFSSVSFTRYTSETSFATTRQHMKLLWYSVYQLAFAWLLYLSIYLSLEFETKFAIVRSVASPKFHENSYLDIFRRISYLLFSYVISRVIKILTFRIILNLEKVYNTCTIKTCCFFWFVLSPFTSFILYIVFAYLQDIKSCVKIYCLSKVNLSVELNNDV